MIQKFVIYVHARNDVIRPAEIEVKVDMPVTSGFVLKNLAIEIATQIEKVFPMSRAKDVFPGIIPIIKQAYWRSEPLLAGVVLKVPGTIEDHRTKVAGSTISTTEVQVKIDQIQQGYEQLLQEARNKAILLETDLDTAQQQVKILQARIQRLQNEERRSGAIERELQIAKQQLEEKEQEIRNKEKQLEDAKQQLEEILEKKGELETHLERARQNAAQSEKIVAMLNSDVAQLRRENALLESDKKALQQQVEKQEAKRTVSGVKPSESATRGGRNSRIVW